MPQTIFFSWQSDTPTRTGRNFLREALEEACRAAGKGTITDEAQRELAVDSDTQDVPGQPPIVDTIFKKIDAAAIFVADMTFVAARNTGGRSPNPNVLIEYGWALKSLKHERVISVMNTIYGEPTGEALPFDLRHARFPMRYNLAEDASSDAKNAEKKRLAKALEHAIRACLQYSAQPKPLIELFDRRLAIYDIVRKAVGQMISSSTAFDQAREVEFMEAMEKAYFLFGDDVTAYLNQLWSDVLDVRTVDAELVGTIDRDTRRKMIERRRAALSRIGQFHSTGRPLFDPYVRFS